jgi:hypothetical protein
VELAKAKKLIADAKKKEKAAYGNMFSKISVYDDKEVPVVTQLSSPSNTKVYYSLNLLLQKSKVTQVIVHACIIGVL